MNREEKRQLRRLLESSDDDEEPEPPAKKAVKPKQGKKKRMFRKNREQNLMSLLFLGLSILFKMAMNEPILQEAGTYQGTNVAESFFHKLPTDNRYIAVGEQQFEPKSSVQV